MSADWWRDRTKWSIICHKLRATHHSYGHFPVMQTNTAARISPSWKIYIFSCSLNGELGLSLFNIDLGSHMWVCHFVMRIHLCRQVPVVKIVVVDDHKVTADKVSSTALHFYFCCSLLLQSCCVLIRFLFYIEISKLAYHLIPQLSPDISAVLQSCSHLALWDK